jgi:hypothetical protein
MEKTRLEKSRKLTLEKNEYVSQNKKIVTIRTERTTHSRPPVSLSRRKSRLTSSRPGCPASRKNPHQRSLPADPRSTLTTTLNWRRRRPRRRSRRSSGGPIRRPSGPSLIGAAGKQPLTFQHQDLR